MFFVSDAFLESILLEDIPYGDVTTSLLGIENAAGEIVCFPKADGYVSGVTLAERLFRMTGLAAERLAEDGAFVTAGTPILKAHGKAGSIHAVYKTAQNIMEYCSGITGRARGMVEAAQSVTPSCQVVTRKSAPAAAYAAAFSSFTPPAAETSTSGRRALASLMKVASSSGVKRSHCRMSAPAVT